MEISTSVLYAGGTAALIVVVLFFVLSLKILKALGSVENSIEKETKCIEMIISREINRENKETNKENRIRENKEINKENRIRERINNTTTDSLSIISSSIPSTSMLSASTVFAPTASTAIPTAVGTAANTAAVQPSSIKQHSTTGNQQQALGAVLEQAIIEAIRSGQLQITPDVVLTKKGEVKLFGETWAGKVGIKLSKPDLAETKKENGVDQAADQKADKTTDQAADQKTSNETISDEDIKQIM